MAGSGKRFQPGQSGNPAGRPVGQMTERKALRGEVERLNKQHNIIENFAKAAEEGDTVAAKWFCDRLVPPLKSQSAPVDILQGRNMASLKDAARTLLEAMMSGRISPSVFAEVIGALESYAKVVEVSALLEEMAELRQHMESQLVGQSRTSA